jgi:hypothetical protein
MTFSDLVDQHVGLAFRKQLALADFLGKHSWQLDVTRGTVDFGKSGLFGKRRVYRAQILGSEAESSGTWLWAWANKQSNFPVDVLKAVNRVKAFGEENAISELLEPALNSTKFPGHLVAMVCTGITGADCYYRGPYPGGAAFFLVLDTPLRDAPATPTVRVINVLTQVVSEYSANHRAMAEAYLKAEGFRVKSTGDGFSATAEDGRALSIRFDDRGRFAGLQTVARPRTT